MNLMLMSIMASAMILVGLLLRFLTFTKLTKITFVFLWLLVLIRLLIPFEMPVGFTFDHQESSSYLVDGDSHRFFAEEVTTRREQERTLPLQNGAYVPEQSVQQQRLTFPNLWDSPQRLFWIWGIGATSLMLYFVVGHVKFLRWIRDSIPVENQAIQSFLDRYQPKLKRKIQIRQSQKVASPLTYGLIKPVILVPKTLDWENARQLESVFVHEYVHIKRLDCLIKTVAMVALCVHWFNPLVWVMYVLIHRDLELSCDEKVLRLLGEGNKSTYALALIDLAEKQHQLMTTGSYFSKHVGIKTRIQAMGSMRRGGLLSVIGTSLAMVLVGSGMFVYASGSADPLRVPEDHLHFGENKGSQERQSSEYPVDFESVNLEYPITFGDFQFTAVDTTWASEEANPHMDHEVREEHLSIEAAGMIVIRESLASLGEEIDGANIFMMFWIGEEEEQAYWNATVVDPEDATHALAHIVIDATTGEVLDFILNTPETPFHG